MPKEQMSSIHQEEINIQDVDKTKALEKEYGIDLKNSYNPNLPEEQLASISNIIKLINSQDQPELGRSQLQNVLDRITIDNDILKILTVFFEDENNQYIFTEP